MVSEDAAEEMKEEKMSEIELGVVEDTLYVPMLGRIYASECFR